MDEDTKNLILKRMDENHQDLKDVKAAILKIQVGIVGQDHCDAYRTDFARKLQLHDDQIREIKTVCDGYTATKPDLVNGVDLKEAKDDAIQHFGDRYDDLEARVDKIEDRGRLIDLTWNTVRGNTVLKGAFSLWGLAIVLIAYDRIRVAIIEYGLYTVVVSVGVIIIGLLLLWIMMNRDATKKLMMRL